MTTTWNPADKLNVNLTNGNLTGSWPGNGFSGARSTTSKSTGKFYVEWSSITMHGDFNAGSNLLGLANSSYALGTQMQSGNACASCVPCREGDGSITVNGGTQLATLGASYSGHVLCMAVDVGAELVWFRIDGGNWNGSGTADPSGGVDGVDFSAITSGLPVFLVCNLTDISTPCTVTLNTGASAFAETVPGGFAPWDGSLPANLKRSYGTVMN